MSKRIYVITPDFKVYQTFLEEMIPKRLRDCCVFVGEWSHLCAIERHKHYYVELESLQDDRIEGLIVTKGLTLLTFGHILRMVRYGA